MEKLNRHSLVFMADLINCMIDDCNISIICADDDELLDTLDFVNNKLRKAYIKLNNFNTRRNYNVK